jgi:hypothetical protein
MIDVTLYTRRECGLCQEMEYVLAGEMSRFDARLTRVEIDGDTPLEVLYGREVPLLFLNDRKAFKFKCTPHELRQRMLREVRR